MHTLGVHSDRSIEATHETFLSQYFLEARRLSWVALERIWESLTPGMTELEAGKKSVDVLKEMGSPRNWHRPIIRFGKNTALPYSVKSDGSSFLTENIPVMIDIGPVWKVEGSDLEYEGDVGDTRVFGKNEKAEACAQAARELFEGACHYWRSEKCSGDAIYRWLDEGAAKKNYRLVETVDGHRLGDFPHVRFFKGSLAAVNFTPAPDVWMLEVHLKTPGGEFGAFYEDALISVD
jgi:hypothetical protein